MKNEELKFEEIEALHTLGGTGKVMSRGEGSGEGVDATDVLGLHLQTKRAFRCLWIHSSLARPC